MNHGYANMIISPNVNIISIDELNITTTENSNIRSSSPGRIEAMKNLYINSGNTHF